LLRHIPGLQVATLPASIRCCGAAGSYMIDHPYMANALRNDALDAIAASQPTALLTSNPGCALHLRAGLRSRGLDVEVLHPITLLARQLRPQP
jgi:glycolate oxidase iron-sulfur subunit